MTDDLETRLRAALRDQADDVTESRLTRTVHDLPADVGSGGRRRRPGQSWLVAAAAAVVVAAGATGIVLSTRQATPTPEPVATVTVTPAPGPTSAPTSVPTPSGVVSPAPGTVTPREEPRSAIPWSQVGPGWSAASWATSAQASSATLYLVSPSGTRYAIGAIPPTGVYDITADGRRVLTGSNDPDAILEWDVPAGTSRTIALGQPGGATYTKPDGKGLLTAQTSGRTMRMQRRGLDGSLQLTFPDDTGVASMSPDGLDLVAGTTAGLAVYGNATGALIRTLTPPSGYGFCQVVSWWPDGRALTLCALGGNGVANLWLYRLDGSAPTALTAATAGSATPFGYQNAWPVSSGTLVQEGVGCGVGPLAMLTSPGTSQRIAFTLPGFPASTHPNPDPVAVVGDVAYLVVSTAECGGAQTRSLVAYDVVTGRSGVLLGPNANGGTVGPVVVIDPSR